MNSRWLVVEPSVGLSHQVGAVVEQVFAVDPLAVAHVVAFGAFLAKKDLMPTNDMHNYRVLFYSFLQ